MELHMLNHNAKLNRHISNFTGNINYNEYLFG